MSVVLQLKTEIKGAEQKKVHLEEQLLYLKSSIKVLQKELEQRIN